jgi:hypothetical protein
MTIPPPTARAVQVAVAVEAAWALYLLYIVHHYEHLPWRLEVANYVNSWANGAIAIVVVTWLLSVALTQPHRSSGPAA